MCNYGAAFLLLCHEASSGHPSPKLAQEALDAISENLDIRYSVDYNGPPAGCHAKLELTNTGAQTIPIGNWAGYFCILRVARSSSEGLRLSHVNGCLHKFEITAPPEGLVHNKTLTVYFDATSGSVAKTDIMPNWYVVAEGLEARTLGSTSGESLSFVGEFDSPRKWKLSDTDSNNPLTPADRFQKNRHLESSQTAHEHLVIPQPKEVEDLDRSMHVDLRAKNWTIFSGAGLNEEARLLAGKLNAPHAMRLL